jgi:hypothetical protein
LTDQKTQSVVIGASLAIATIGARLRAGRPTGAPLDKPIGS